MTLQPTHSDSRYLWFQRHNRLYAVHMEHLQEVFPAPQLRILPASEPSLVGLLSLRDHVFPVFDPQSFAGHTEASIDLSNKIVIALTIEGRLTCGLLAEKVGKVISLPALLPITAPVRHSAAFAGEFKTTNSEENGLVFSVIELARSMGLNEEPQQTPAMAA
jgi:chemotaxis signal transduction protein